MPKRSASTLLHRSRCQRPSWHSMQDSGDGDTPSAATSSRIKHVIYSSTSDGRLKRRTHYTRAAASPTKAATCFSVESEAVSNAAVLESDSPVEDSLNTVMPEIVADQGLENTEGSYHHYIDDVNGGFRAGTRSSVCPMDTWKNHREQFLDELLRLDGRCDAAALKHCTICAMYCEECLRQKHTDLPLHRVEKWNGSHFERATLKSLGLRIQLGHDGGPCAHPRSGPEDFIVIHTNGLHSVAIDFCGCDRIQAPHVQLLRAQWYPATIPRPKTCATFHVLENFHLSTFESKASAFEFFQTISRLTDNSGTLDHKDRYPSFLRIVRQWRNLKMLKRSGRGHDPSGIAGTRPGDCAIQCPACPIPEVNLPNSWELVPIQDRWLYGLILAVDANFRQKNKARAGAAADPPLGEGWSYFVEEEMYKKHLSHYGLQKDISTCARHSAMSQANKDTRGLSTMGVGATVCARHQFMRPNGIVDLQKGERYCNMDYAVFSTLRHNRLLRHLVMSYNINCQWSKNVWQHMRDLPNEFQLDLGTFTFTAVIPKFHLPAHQEECQAPYSFNLAVGVGNTDGKGIERNWQVMNAVGPSTQEMGPGAHHDTLDDHYGDLNWRKTVGLGRALNDRLENAVPERNLQCQNFKDMSARISQSQLKEWGDMVESWEKDHTLANPYDIPRAGMTQAQVREQLAAAEAQDANNGVKATHEVSPCDFLALGLKLESQQRQLMVDVTSTKTGTSEQMAAIHSRRTLLRRKINAWIEVQAVYMPIVPQLRIDEGRTLTTSAECDHAEAVKLWLPSSLSVDQRAQGCQHSLPDNEWRLRLGQAYDALSSLRHHLRHLAYLHKFRLTHVRGQGPNTKVRTLIDHACKLRDNAVKTYRTAYEALLRLDTTRDCWQAQLQKLNNADVRFLGQGSNDDPDSGHKHRWKTGKSNVMPRRENGTLDESEGLDSIPADQVFRAADPSSRGNKGLRLSESRRTVSWIWAAAGAGEVDDGQDPGLADALRVEWARCRARSHRWEEEVILLQEEMRRVKAYLVWREMWWLERRTCRTVADGVLAEGIAAYAAKQAMLQRALCMRFSTMWAPTIAWAAEQLAIGDAGGNFDTQHDRPGRLRRVDGFEEAAYVELSD